MTHSPHEVAERIAKQAPDDTWLRTLVDDLDRRLRTVPIERFMSLWGLSAAEAARAFGVSPQAFSKWRRHGVPRQRAGSLADLAAATDLLDRYVKRERIPAVVRRPAAQLDGHSLLAMACEGRHAELREAAEAMFDLRRIQA